MRTYLILILLLPTQLFGKAPECPLYPTKKDCLRSVESNYDSLLDFINESTEEGEPEREKLIEASRDIKKYESLACQRTCFN